MNRALLRKSIAEARWLWLACAAALFAFCWVRVWIVGRLDTGRFKAILDLLPDDWQRFSPVDFAWLITYPGRISLTYDEPVVVLCVTIWAIARGSDCISGEISRGTMEMLLAQPVSRLQVLLTQSLVTVVGVGLLALTAWGGTCAGIYTSTVREEVTPSWRIPMTEFRIPIPFAKPQIKRVPMSEKVNATLFLPAIANLFALGFFLAGLSAAMSSWDRYRWRTIGIVVGFYVVQLIVKIVGMSADELKWMQCLSVFTAFEPEAFVAIADRTPFDTWSIVVYDQNNNFRDLGPLGYDLILVVLGIISYFVSAVIFCRRDLPAPL